MRDFLFAFFATVQYNRVQIITNTIAAVIHRAVDLSLIATEMWGAEG
jgi:hypothetical protein